MNRDNQPTITDVNCKFGAPMGREDWTRHSVSDHSVRVFRVVINRGGYDRGGAYWGIGQPLYCATDGSGFRRFMRAASRDEAIQKMMIPVRLLASKAGPAVVASQAKKVAYRTGGWSHSKSMKAGATE